MSKIFTADFLLYLLALLLVFASGFSVGMNAEKHRNRGDL